MKMTKAERIYYATRYECRQHFESFGYETNAYGTAIGFGSVVCKDDESVCTRTLNEIEKILNAKRKEEEIFLKCGIHDEERTEKEMQIFNMVETTIRNHRESLKALGF